MVKPDGTVFSYTYDPFGRLKTQESSDESVSYFYEYDLLDQLTKVTDKITGQKTELTYLNGELQKETLSNGLSLLYTYDKTGRVKTITFPDNTGVEYCYNAVDLKEVHRLTNGKRTYTHLDLNHSLSGEVTKVQPPGKNKSIEYTFDLLGRCTSITTPSFNQYIPSDGFDKAGNLLKFESQKISYAFTYDDNYQITSEKGHEEHLYSYDSLFNRTKKDDKKHIHNSLNQIKGDEFQYDLNGNLIKQTKNGKATHYSYDALDRLISVENDQKTNYQYDHLNRRISRNQNGQEELFIYQGQEEIGCWFNDQIQELRLLGKNERSPMVALELDGIPYAPIHDLSGNLVCLLDHQGEIVEEYRYTAFGESEIFDSTGNKLPQSSVKNPWQYASKRLDKESGLIAFGIRYYDPSLGRWITPDPQAMLMDPISMPMCTTARFYIMTSLGYHQFLE